MKKLTLRKEIVRSLTGAELVDVHGGERESRRCTEGACPTKFTCP